MYYENVFLKILNHPIYLIECTTLATGYLEGNGAIFCNTTFEYKYTAGNTNDNLEFECSQCPGDDESISEFGK